MTWIGVVNGGPYYVSKHVQKKQFAISQLVSLHGGRVLDQVHPKKQIQSRGIHSLFGF